MLAILRDRIVELRRSYSRREGADGSMSRSPYRVLFPNQSPEKGDNYTPEFGHFPTRKLRPNPLTRPYFSRSTDSNKGLY